MKGDRSPPARIRITGLQEAQLPDLLELERACCQMYYDIGFDAAEVPARTTADFAALPRDHDVRVAEADHVVAGYMAWRDESPGVAYLADISVHPDHQRFGVGTRLLEAFWEGARDVGLEVAVVRVWQRATWATAFYAKAGFTPLSADVPAKVLRWREEREASGRPLTRPGEQVLWARVAPKPPEPEDEDGDEDAAT